MASFDWSSAVSNAPVAASAPPQTAAAFDWAKAAMEPRNTAALIPHGLTSADVQSVISGARPASPKAAPGIFGNGALDAFMQAGSNALGPQTPVMGVSAAARQFNKLANASASNVIAAHPVAAEAGRLTATLVPMMLGAEGAGGAADAFLPKATGALSSLARRAAIGSIEGATAAAIPNPQAGESRIGSAASGALVGGLLPVGFSTFGKGASIARKAVAPFTTGGRERLLGSALKDIAGGVPEATDAPLPGMQLSLGQSTENPGLVALEKGVFATPYGQTLYAQMRGANNKALLSAASTIADRVDPNNLGQISADLADNLTAARQAVHDREAELYGAVDPDNAVRVSTKGVRKAVQGAINSLGSVRSRLIPAQVLNTLDNLKPDIPFMQLKDVRSVLGNMQRQAAFGGDMNSAEAIGRVHGAVTNYMEGLAEKLKANPEYAGVVKRWQAANDFSRQKNEIFRKNPLGNIFSRDATGAERVEPENVGARLFSPQKPSGIEQAQNALDLAGAPQNKADLQNWLMSKWVQAAGTPQVDAEGNPILSAARFSKFYHANKPLFDRVFKNQTSQAVLQKMLAAAQKSDRIQNFTGTGGSPTAMNLSTHRLIDELIGNTFLPTGNEGGAGGALAADLAFGPHAALGGYVAGKVLPSVLRQVRRPAASKMQELLYRAVTDPDVGMALMRNATDANRGHLSQVLGRYTPRVIQRVLPGALAVSASQ